MTRSGPSSFKITPIGASPERLANHRININDSSSALNEPASSSLTYAAVTPQRWMQGEVQPEQWCSEVELINARVSMYIHLYMLKAVSQFKFFLNEINHKES